MSTRGCIARLQKHDPLEFKGVYHHWDSYPSGLGQALFQMRNKDFNGDTKEMLKVLIDQHPAGWSSVIGKDFRLKPGFRAHAHDDGREIHPQCYCHGDRNEPSSQVTHKNAAGSGIEYAYLFDGSKMIIAGSFCDNGGKMVGMFGCGDPEAVWSVIAEADLDGPEPGWEALDQAGRMEVEEGAQISCSAANRKSSQQTRIVKR